MKKKMNIPGFLAIGLLALSGCQSATLLELNRQFNDVSVGLEQAKILKSTNQIDATQFEVEREAYKISLLEIAKQADLSYQKADTPQSQASFLNIKARSYFRAGGNYTDKLYILAEKGKEVCAKISTSNTADLPATCGYFYLVVAQGISKTEEAKLVKIVNMATAEAKPDAAGALKWPASYGGQMVDIVGHLLGELDKINANIAKGNIDLQKSSKEFKIYTNHEKMVYLCNARTTITTLKQTEKTAGDWDRDKIITDQEAKLTISAKESLNISGIPDLTQKCTGLKSELGLS